MIKCKNLYRQVVDIIAARLNWQLAEVGSHAVFGTPSQADALVESLVDATIDDLHRVFGDGAIEFRAMERAALEAITLGVPAGGVVYVAVPDDAAETGDIEVAATLTARRAATFEDCQFARRFVEQYTKVMRQKESRVSSAA